MKALAPCLMLCLAVLCVQGSAGPEETASAELEALQAKVPGFRVLDLPADGALALTAEQALTVELLRGVELDAEPPVLGVPEKPYDPRMADDCPPDRAPYVAPGIQPFRFRFFTNEFNYGGWHTFTMADYAAAHGFSVLSPYVRKPGERAHLPAGTKWLKWGGFVDWPKWLAKHDMPEGRYDSLMDLDVTAELVREGVFKPDQAADSLMIDLEHPLLSPEQLRQQPWYPKDSPEADRAAFERRYYDGYARTYIAPIQAARQAGYRDISLYGWQPFPRTYWGLDKAQVDPESFFPWVAYGRQIYEAVDILNPSVYCFYWTAQNVAYTLANIDLNRKLIATMPTGKPTRPYYWTLLHGGGGGERWWAGQPLPTEEARAMTALCFFAGCDGLVQWNWSGTGSHQVPPPLKEGADVMVGVRLELRPEGAPPDGPLTPMERYEVLHITSVAEDGTVRFQVLDKANRDGKHGLSPDGPTYAMKPEELIPHLRAAAEPVAGVIEGLALVKPLEYLLRHGEVKADVSAQEQFGATLPIVRRIRLGRTHVLATYDPACVHGGEPRTVVLQDFDGRQGRTLTLPADAQTRLFVLRE